MQPPEPPSDLEHAEAAFLAAARRLDQQAATELVRAYSDAWLAIRAQLNRFLARIEGARDVGQEPGLSWLFQQSRLQVMLDQVEAEIARFAGFAESTISRAQLEAVYQARAHAENLLQLSLPLGPPGITATFAAVPTVAMLHLVGTLQDGSPLRSLLDALGADASAAVRKALITGLATGSNPRTIARVIRRDVDMTRTRALTISRTEILRSYRSSALSNYQANSGVVRGWVWLATLDERCCPVCWAMHGTVHPLSEPFVSHINCRCSPAPLTSSWAELGFSSAIPETTAQVEPGPQRFASLSAARQATILGPAAFRAYRARALSLEALVGRKFNPRWGPSLYRRSLRQVLGIAPAQRFVHPPRP